MPIDQTQIVTTINKVFEEKFEISPDLLTPDNLLFDDIGLDSLDIVDLIFALQKAFDLHIREDDRVREIRTLGDLHKLVQTVLEEKEQAG